MCWTAFTSPAGSPKASPWCEESSSAATPISGHQHTNLTCSEPASPCCGGPTIWGDDLSDRRRRRVPWARRLTARTVDLAACAVLVGAGAFAAGWFGWGWFLPEGGVILYPAAVLFLYEILGALFGGTTLGKLAMSLRVVDADNTLLAVGRRRAMARSAVLYSPVLIWGALQTEPVGLAHTEPWLLLVATAPYAIWVAHYQLVALHNLVAHTAVVKA